MQRTVSQDPTSAKPLLVLMWIQLLGRRLRHYREIDDSQLLSISGTIKVSLTEAGAHVRPRREEDLRHRKRDKRVLFSMRFDCYINQFPRRYSSPQL